jgi:hypothetical protein
MTMMPNTSPMPVMMSMGKLRRLGEHPTVLVGGIARSKQCAHTVVAAPLKTRKA